MYIYTYVYVYIYIYTCKYVQLHHEIRGSHASGNPKHCAQTALLGRRARFVAGILAEFIYIFIYLDIYIYIFVSGISVGVQKFSQAANLDVPNLLGKKNNI